MPGSFEALLALFALFFALSGMFSSEVCEDDPDHNHDEDSDTESGSDSNQGLDIVDMPPVEPVSM